MDWDTYWRFELFRRRADPLDFRRWKRDSQRELRKLHPGDGVLLLDSTAGLGDHTVNLAEEGFRVEACDDSEIALEATRAAVHEAGVDVPVFRARWEALGRPGRYDLIFNDALHWVYEPDAMRAALAGFLDALKPGGALVFFFADQANPREGHGLEMLASDWDDVPAARVGWDHTVGDDTVTLALTFDRGTDHVDERHVYVSRRAGEPPEAAALTVRHVYRWDWYALSRVLEEAGYVELRTDHFQNVKGRWYAMSRAFKPVP